MSGAGQMPGCLGDDVGPCWLGNIFVRTLSGGTLTLDASADDTAGILKCKIHSINRMPSEQQRLIYAGRELKDRKTLQECHIQPGHLLYLLRKPSTVAERNRSGKQARRPSVVLCINPASPRKDFRFVFAEAKTRRSSEVAQPSGGLGVWQPPLELRESWLDTSFIGYQLANMAAARTAAYLSAVDQEGRLRESERPRRGSGSAVVSRRRELGHHRMFGLVKCLRTRRSAQRTER